MGNRSVIGGRACRLAKNIDEYLSARQEGRGKVNPKKGLKKGMPLCHSVGETHEAGNSMKTLQQEASIPPSHDWRQIGRQKVWEGHR